jgi:hypothetical protein
MPSKKRAHLQQFGIIHLSNINLTYIRSPERENYVYALLVEIGPEGGRRHNSPRNASLPSLLSRSYFRYSRRGKEMRKYLTEQEMQQGNTWQTEDRKTSSSLRCSLLITVYPFHYKGFTIYRSPLGMVICLNYTFFVPDKRL